MTGNDKIKEKSIDPSVHQMLERAHSLGLETAWDRYEAMQPLCGFGELGVCCRNCNMGPCRISPFEDGPQKGICGATADIIVARNLIRMIAAGAAAHSDHGRDLAHTLLLTAERKCSGYKIKDKLKLAALAKEYNIEFIHRSVDAVALDLAKAVYAEFGRQEGFLQFTRRAPEKRIKIWQKFGIDPRGVDREIVEIMHRTHIGVDNDAVNLILQGLKASIADGWGGSTIATEISDVLFGTPKPIRSQANLGVLKEDQVNIIVHGHEPVLSEMIVAAANESDLISLSHKKGAAGINITGICCTGNEVCMRHGIPMAGNFLQQELAIITGAVDAMIVDVQCIMPAIGPLSECFHTKIISTSPKAKFPSTIHMEFHEEKGIETARDIVKTAVENYSNRNPEKIMIPEHVTDCMVGFSTEAIIDALGGTTDPLIEAITYGNIRGIAGVVGCNNPKIKHDHGHVALVKELLINDVLVVTTGCNAMACAKEGLMLPESAEQAGEGLKAVCQTLGIPPVLHMGSCVDISRILTLCAAIANRLDVDISDLPVAGAAPEWMSEKAVSIGAYVVSSGIFTVLGTVPPVLGSKLVTEVLTKTANDVVGAAFAVETDPIKGASLMVAHIDKKREALSI